MPLDWSRSRVLVTGGASFIGSHLVDALVSRRAQVRVVDDLSSGCRENLAEHLANADLEFIHADLRDPGVSRNAMQDIDVVFHLAADHGGRGYVETFQAGPASNFLLDGVVFREALKAEVGKLVFASSGCVYPNRIQNDPTRELYLSEDMVCPPHDADNLYGWAKLMGEQVLRAYHREYGLKSASCRYFTVYGPRGKEDHAVMAMIGRAFVGQSPFEVWGSGEQIRNWTYVDDIVEGTLRAAEELDDGTAVNLGTMERIRVLDAVKLVLQMSGRDAQIRTLPDMPTGPLNRVADNRVAREKLGWVPQFSFREGLRRTIEWYVRTKNPREVQAILDGGGLIGRKLARSHCRS